MAGHLTPPRLTYALAFHCVPEGDGPIRVARHDLSPLRGPGQCAYLGLAEHGSVEFRQFFPAGFVELEHVDLPILPAASEEIVAVVVKVQAADSSAFVVPQGVDQFGLLGLGEAGVRGRYRI